MSGREKKACEQSEGIEEKLWLYIEKIREEAETEKYTNTWKQWVFGAIDFAHEAELIDGKAYVELVDRYNKEIKGS